MSDDAGVDLTVVELVEPGEETAAPGPYEGMIVSDEKEVDEILRYLEDEISREEARVDGGARAKWAKFRRQMDLVPEQSVRTGPIKNPSNVVPPLSMIHGQTMYAEISKFFGSRKPFWTVGAVRDLPIDRRQAKLWTKYLGILAISPTDLNLGPIQRRVAQEAAVMPLCMVKVPWTTVEWNFKTKDGEGEAQAVKTVYRDGPEIVVIAREDLLFPSTWSDVTTMPWIDHRLHLPKHVVEAKEARGRWRNVEKVLDWEREHSEKFESDVDRAEGKAGERHGIIDIDEVHFYWDTDGDREVEDLIWWIHRPSRTVLCQDYNVLGVRDFVDFKFIERAFSIEGRGTGQICEHLQDEAEGIHNLRNDNMKVVAMRMIAVRRSVMLSNKEDIYPGKIWITDSPKEDIAPVQLGEVYPSSLEAENWTWSMAAQGTGASEVLRGFSDPRLGSRDTYRGQALRSGNSQGLFGSIAQGMEEQWSRVGMLVVFNLIKNKERVIANEEMAGRLTPEEITMLKEMLSLEVGEIPRKFRFTTQTTDLDMTYEALKQSVLTVMQLQMQYLQMTTPLAMQLFSPQGQLMMQVAPELYSFQLKMLTGITKLTESAFKFFHVEDTENYLPETGRWDQLLGILKMMQQAMGGIGGGPNGRGENADGGFAGLAGAAGAGAGIPSATGTADGGGSAGGGGGGAPAGVGAGAPSE